MRLNFNNEAMISSLSFWLETWKAEHETSAFSDGTDNPNTILQLD